MNIIVDSDRNFFASYTPLTFHANTLIIANDYPKCTLYKIIKCRYNIDFATIGYIDKLEELKKLIKANDKENYDEFYYPEQTAPKCCMCFKDPSLIYFSLKAFKDRDAKNYFLYCGLCTDCGYGILDHVRNNVDMLNDMLLDLKLVAESDIESIQNFKPPMATEFDLMHKISKCLQVKNLCRKLLKLERII